MIYGTMKFEKITDIFSIAGTLRVYFGLFMQKMGFRVRVRLRISVKVRCGLAVAAACRPLHWSIKTWHLAYVAALPCETALSENKRLTKIKR